MVIDMSNLDIKQIDVCDMKDFHIGSAEDLDKLTGVTVISSKEGATASVDVRGGGPATRETDLLSPEHGASYPCCCSLRRKCIWS